LPKKSFSLKKEKNTCEIVNIAELRFTINTPHNDETILHDESVYLSGSSALCDNNFLTKAITAHEIKKKTILNFNEDAFIYKMLNKLVLLME
jgi:hypothetical protein